MAFPDDLTTVTVTHPVADPALRPLPGVVVATPTGRQWKQGEGSILPAEYTAPIEGGVWTLVLPAVDQFVNLEAYRIEERPTEGGKPWGRPYHIAPTLDHAPGPVDATDVITTPPRGGDIVFTAGPATDSSMAQVAADPNSEFGVQLRAAVEEKAGTVPIFGSQAEAQAWEAEHPGGTALWFDAGFTEVVASGPTWADEPLLGGGTWTTPNEEGVTYTPASGTADPGQTITVTASAQPGYVLLGETSWTYTFPQSSDTAMVDFTDDTVGALPAGWATRWVQDAGAWTVIEHSAATGNRALEHRASSNARRGLAWTLLDALNTTDLEAALKWRTATANNPPRIVVRGSGSDGTESGYYAGIRNASNEAMGKLVDGATTLPLGPQESFTVQADEWYVTRFRVVGNQLMSKTWLAADTEPSEWTLTTTDTDLTADGWVGLYCFGAGVMLFDWLSVAINGKTAPLGA